MAHIGDVIELALGWDRDIWSVPGRDLAAFGDRVREWAGAVDPAVGVQTNAAYYGGWPSANVPTVGWAGLIGTILLMEHQVVGKDPISDWFSMEQYRRGKRMGARHGWLNDDGSPAIDKTRAFLSVQLPLLRRLRPLLDSGVLHLVPSEAILLQRRAVAQTMSSSLADTLLADPIGLSARFGPPDLPVDDDIRGMFLLCGGDIAEQTAKYLSSALDYFANEFVLASACGATYTSVLDWEHHILTQGLDVTLSPTIPTNGVLLASHLPVFTGLTPEVIAKIHGDEALGDFRSELTNIYGGCPSSASTDEVQLYVADRESTMLQPVLARVEKSIDRGPMSRLGLGLDTVKYSLIGGLTGFALADPSSRSAALAGGMTLAGLVADAVAANRPTGTTKIWASLVRHGLTAQQAIPAELLPGQTGPGDSDNPWGFDSEPSGHVKVTAGSLQPWWGEPPPNVQVAGYADGPYASCPCSSTLKYRSCCAGVPGAASPSPV